MRLIGLSNEIIFDEFEEYPVVNNKIKIYISIQIINQIFPDNSERFHKLYVECGNASYARILSGKNIYFETNL